VIGDGREVERPPQLRRARGIPRRIERRDADPFAAREPIRVARRVVIALDLRVEREARVHVQIAEEGTAQRVVLGARGARVGQHLDGVGRIVARIREARGVDARVELGSCVGLRG